MAVISFWATELKDARAAVTLLLKALLSGGYVDGIYVPLHMPGGEGVVPALVCDVHLLEQADPLAPVMLINGARAVASLTVSPGTGKLAAVLRPCEIRALVELAKLKQANLDGLTIIGMDCAGTYDVTEYVRLRASGVDPAAQLLAETAEGGIHRSDRRLRPACEMCEFPVAGNAQINIGFVGVDGLMIQMDEEMAATLGPAAGTTAGGSDTVETRRLPAWPVIPPGDLSFRQDIIQRLVSERTARRDAVMAELGARLTGAAALAEYFSACQRCHNCMVACPICYCKECLFRTAALEHDPASYLRWAGRKGAVRMPADTVLFHLTRLNHMSTSCVGCGLCESACPSDIPLTAFFRTVAGRTQALFDYVPGRRLDEQMPLMTFREAELQDMG